MFGYSSFIMWMHLIDMWSETKACKCRFVSIKRHSVFYKVFNQTLLIHLSRLEAVKGILGSFCPLHAISAVFIMYLMWLIEE